MAPAGYRSKAGELHREEAIDDGAWITIVAPRGNPAMALPTGTVTVLFTDIEGSTRVWEEQPDAMRLALPRHDALLRAAIETNKGHVFKTVGDAFCAVFSTAPEALDAALALQQSLRF